MQQDKQPVCRHLDPRNLKALLEGSAVALFSSVAEIELLNAPDGHLADCSLEGCTAIVNFSGYQQGFLAFACSGNLTRLLAKNMLEETDELNNHHLSSVMGEAAVILLTGIFEGIPGRSCHTVSAPAVICNDSSFMRKLLADTRGSSCSFYYGSEWAVIKLVIHPENCLHAAPDNDSSHLIPMSVKQAHRLLTCPRFGHPCRQELHPEPIPLQTSYGRPLPARPIHRTFDTLQPDYGQ